MWASESALIGAQCEFANAPVNSVTDRVLTPYMRNGFHCAIGDGGNPAFGKGENCGKCYHIWSLNDNGIYGTPGHKGSAHITVTNGGAGGSHHFDCIADGFKAITGASTGVFAIEYEEVTCDEVTGSITAINWADKNAYYCKMMFENVGLWGGISSVESCLNGNSCKPMQRAGGATWTGCPQGEGSSMLFKLTQVGHDGHSRTVDCNCPYAWPWNNGARCDCKHNFAVSSEVSV